jgi:hypothetical protein
MIHAKVSPSTGVFVPFYLKDVPEAHTLLTVCEEARVNYLASSNGYNTKLLVDGSESLSGERAARSGIRNDVTLGVTALIGTGGLNSYISGIRRAVRPRNERQESSHQTHQVSLA